MKAYSIDLRERVIRSAQNGRGQSWIAREFGIALGTVKRYLKRYQTKGTLQPTPQRREQPRIGEADLPALQAQVDVHPDAPIAQHIDYWAASHGLRVGQATMCRALQRANRPLKKNAAGVRTR